ncbi:MAG: 50S ribosomal protein L4 [Acidobacteriaceae bacterium]
MTKTSVLNQAGEKVSELDLNPKIFGLEKIKANLVFEAVRAQHNNARSSSAHTKNRGEVQGSGKKPWKQKGTGRARAGSVRSPLWRHGGVTFGPRNDRNFSVKINRSAFRSAVFSILTDKVNEGKLVIVDKFTALEKTNQMAKAIAAFAEKAGLGKKIAFIVDKTDKVMERTLKNIPNKTVLVANRLNVVDLLHHDLIATKDALELIEKTYLK